jgi:membrane-associated phospholipid phosphatase
MKGFNLTTFRKGLIISILIAAILFTCSFTLGKINFFLLLNGNLGLVADNFFAVWTNMGDGLIWIAVLLIVVFVLKRKDTIWMLISGFVLSTLFAQICKWFIVPDAPRPSLAIADKSLIHSVKGVELYTVSSFPSGHTSTAFTVYLLFCLLINGNWWLIAGLLYALLVGYSRIYLAEHFPLDVAAGVIVGILSAWLSLQLQQYINKKK